jgi:hypothetical protein
MMVMGTVVVMVCLLLFGVTPLPRDPAYPLRHPC